MGSGASADGSASSTRDSGAEHQNGTMTHRLPPPPPPANAEALYKQGLQSFVRGDTKGALAALQKAKAANPGFAPTWRVLGQVYEKLGDHAAAKNAFDRYLKLAPGASDAEMIRARLEPHP